MAIKMESVTMRLWEILLVHDMADVYDNRSASQLCEHFIWNNTILAIVRPADEQKIMGFLPVAGRWLLVAAAAVTFIHSLLLLVSLLFSSI